MKIKEHQEIIVFETEDGDFNRVYDKKHNELYWYNGHIKFYKNVDGTWSKYSTRKYPKIMSNCFLEDDYKELIRIEKLNRIINEE